MSQTINVLFLAAEAEPFVKVGGLGDVAGTLPRALRALSNDGMAEFERAGYGYRQELKRVQKLYVADQIDHPEFERRSRILQEKLNASLPAAHPDAASLLAEYRPFAKVWRQLDNGQKRALLDIMFAGLYFDRSGKLIRAVAYEPFREAMGLPQGGMIEQL